MDTQNKSEQEAGEGFSASSGNYVFTRTSRTKVNRGQGRSSPLAQVTVFTRTSRTKVKGGGGESSLLAQVTMCSHGHPEQK